MYKHTCLYNKSNSVLYRRQIEAGDGCSPEDTLHVEDETILDSEVFIWTLCSLFVQKSINRQTKN